jgi:hypothetical protein
MRPFAARAAPTEEGGPVLFPRWERCQSRWRAPLPQKKVARNFFPGGSDVNRDGARQRGLGAGVGWGAMRPLAARAAPTEEGGPELFPRWERPARPRHDVELLQVT